MSKKVFSSIQEVINIWAENYQVKDWGSWTCSSWGTRDKVFAEAGALYSYGRHWKVAQHVDAPTPFTVFNDAPCSPSTDRHAGRAQYTVKRTRTVVVAPSPNLLFTTPKELLANYDLSKLAWEEEFSVKIWNAKKRRSNIYWYMEQLQSAVGQCEMYYNLYGVGIPSGLLTEALATVNDAELREYSDKQKDINTKLNKCWHEINHIKYIQQKGHHSWDRNAPTADEKVTFQLVKIGIFAEHKVKSLRQLPEEAIIELAERTGYVERY